ncbi:MAG: HAD-IIB family hydrolase [Rhodobacteraceae bacterium]|nr:HAD-IIB family hydrolase [Paracoccaceae bacterium]
MRHNTQHAERPRAAPNRARMVLATDLDGTFLGGPREDRARLYDWLRARADEVALFFVTGRDPGAITEICADGFVPAPCHVIGDVGTTIARFDGRAVRPIPELEAEIAETWGDRAGALRAAVARIPSLREQDTPFRYRLSYHYDAGFHPDQVAHLSELGVDVLISHGRFLDILPRGVSKGPSLLRLLDHLGVKADRVLVAGDTLNDLSMFQTGLHGAVVGGAETELLEAVSPLPRAHVCQGIGAAGIIEAIHAHALHPEPPEILP